MMRSVKNTVPPSIYSAEHITALYNTQRYISACSYTTLGFDAHEGQRCVYTTIISRQKGIVFLLVIHSFRSANIPVTAIYILTI